MTHPYGHKYVWIVFTPQLSCSPSTAASPLFPESPLFSLFNFLFIFQLLLLLLLPLSFHPLVLVTPMCLFGFLTISWIDWMELIYKGVAPNSSSTTEENVLLFSQEPEQLPVDTQGRTGSRGRIPTTHGRVCTAGSAGVSPSSSLIPSSSSSMMFPERPAFIRADCSEFRQIHPPKV